MPTEAQWEKAASWDKLRQKKRKYPWGDSVPDSTLLNFNQNVGGATEVGKYPDGASSYGALDIAGNVWEWVADWYGDDFYDYSSYENPAGPSSGGGRVLRGGSWSFGARFVRASYRFWSYPGSRDNIYGFRCSR